MALTIYLIIDPMCSWCWGFRSVWHEFQSELPATVSVADLMGGGLRPIRTSRWSQLPAIMFRGLARRCGANWSQVQFRILGRVFTPADYISRLPGGGGSGSADPIGPKGDV